MKQRDIPQGENMTDEALEQWAQAFGYVATRYRVACSPGSLIAGAPWLKGKPMVPALTQLAREAGLTFQLLTADQHAINSWRLPVVVALNAVELLDVLVAVNRSALFSAVLAV